MVSSTLLREAIAAVKAGQRQYARELFLELVELDPVNETAWIWLSGLLETREDQIKALENSILISKGGPNLESRLQTVGGSEIAPETASLRAAISAAESGQPAKAKALLQQIVASNQDNERAWMALVDVTNDVEQQVVALEHVLRISPNNFKARERLTKAQHLLYKKYLGQGRTLQQRGELRRAVEAYKLAERYASTGSFRAAARQRWELVESRGYGATAENPTITLIRLAVGPPFVFALFLLIQHNVKPLTPFTVYGFALLSVAVGSLLAVAAARVPHHPVWTRIMGPAGLSDPGVKSLFRGVGILLILVPFVLWLLDIAQLFGVISPLF
jgi:hypothetical protein